MKEIKTAIITGVGGQDGSFLAEKLLAKGYNVIGVDRWNPTGLSKNLVNVFNNSNFILISGDITEKNFIHRIFEQYKPDYFYNMGAISYVPESFKIPETVFMTNTVAVLNMLEEIRTYSPKTKFYQASSSEQIGKNRTVPQNTESNMIPNSIYGITKLASYHIIRLYREAYNLFAVNGLLWNHEGTRRGADFVTRKITIAVANIKKGKQEFIELGNMDAIRDWGDAEDFTSAMIMMMEHNVADDYAVSTGEAHSIREFVEEAFKYIGEKITWDGKGLNEVGVNQHNKVRVKINKEFYRPAEVPQLCGDYSKINRILGWKPTTTFKELVKKMMENDLSK